MTLETEVKIFIADFSPLRERLEKLQAEQIKPRLFERNIRYDVADGSFTANGIVLRLRQDDRVRVTYKEDAAQQSGGTTTRLELETEVDDFDAMDAIFRKLGYTTALIYEKYRTTYELMDAEIVLDEMPYGNFIEIEGTVESIEAVIKALGLEDAPRILGSYVVLFNEVKRALNLDFRDLSFENFAGIDVPGEIFEG